jgi:tetratricopeptide (TPR) repeat protein
MFDTGKLQKTTERLWLAFDETDKRIASCLFHVTNPVSIEILVSLSGASITKVLNFMEKLKSKNLVSERKVPGKGIYFLDHVDELLRLTEQSPPGEGVQAATRRIIAFYTANPEESEEKTLILARLYLKADDPSDGLDYLWKAAEILLRSDEREKAVEYYDRLIGLLMKNQKTAENATVLLDAVLRKLSVQMREIPVGEKLSLLGTAEGIAKKFKMWGYLAQIKLAVARDLQISGQDEKASRYIDNLRQIARRIQDPGMLKAAALSTSFFLFSKGNFAEAVRCYEDTIGNLEEFGDDEATLNAGLWVAYSFVICGRVSRGIGMIDAIRTKATSLAIESTIILSDFIAAHAMLEVRNVSEAEFFADRVLGSNERRSGRFILWGAYACKAFVLCAKGEYAGSFDCHRKAWEYARPMGWVHHVGPWTFEYLKTLQENGFRDELMTYESEIDNFIKSGSIYMKGVAFRHRALNNTEKEQDIAQILSDLKNSEKLLKTAGAEIELARTMIALGSYYAQRGDLKSAQPYAQKAFSLFSEVNKDLVPRELLEFMPQELRIDVMIAKMTTLNKSLGKPGDMPYFLGQAVDIAMRFAAAKQGAFFAVEANGEVAEAVCRNLGFSDPNGDDLSSVREIVQYTVDKLGSVVQFLEDVLTNEYGPVWRRILKQMEGLFNQGQGPYWRNPDAQFWKDFEERIEKRD